MKAIYISFRNEAVSTDTSPEGLRRAAEQALTNAATKRSEAEAKTLADDLVKQLRAGADFAKLAETHSEDAPSKAKGGDFGILRNNNSYPEEFRRIVMALQPGAVSEPIRQGYGFYIIRVDAKTVPPVEEVRAEITEVIRQQHVQEWMNGLTTRFAPEIKDPAFFVNRPAPPKQ
jgi:peptidyl-prolyl cis-trans isomerase C